MKILFTGAICLLLSSCATVFSGTKAKIQVLEGIPPKAEVYMNNNFVGQTPLNFTIPKKAFGKEVQIEIRAEGYRPVTINIDKKAQAGFIVLDVLSGLVWLVVDIADGALYKPVNDKIQYKLEKL